MKITIGLIIIFTSFINLLYGQDLIFLKNGKTINTKIVKVNSTEIKYKKPEVSEETIFVISRSEVEKIKYENGVVVNINYDYVNTTKRESFDPHNIHYENDTVSFRYCITVAGSGSLEGVGLNLICDGRIVEDFSLGLAFSQTYFSDNVLSKGIGLSNSTIRTNISLRALGYLNVKKNLYIGLRGGVSFWGDGAIWPSFQGFGGGRIYVTNNIGLNLEIACGSPYFIAAGINYCIK